VGTLAVGKGGGVESDPGGLGRRLDRPGPSLTVLAAEGFQVAARRESRHPLEPAGGWIKPSWQHQPGAGGRSLPAGSLLAGLWETALNRQGRPSTRFSILGYDPPALTGRTRIWPTPLFHLVSIGDRWHG